MKRFLSLVLAMSIFTTSTVFAADSRNSLATMIRDYKVDVRVNNTNPEEALEALVANFQANGVSHAELMEFVRTNLSAEELRNFNAIVEAGKSEMANFDSINAGDFEYILGEAIASSQLNSGANYVGCGIAYGIGVTAIIGGIVLAFFALEMNGTFSSDGLLWGHPKNSERAKELRYSVRVN